MGDPIEEIKTRIDIVEFMKEYLTLSLAGSNYKARCPFHQEKSASLMISPSKQIWHCFGCSEGGDLFSFFMKLEGVEFGEALRILAERAGVKLERQDPRVQGEKNRLLTLLDFASQYFHQALLRSPKGEIARTYVQSRGLDPQLVDEFRIGYALPDFEALNTFLISRKYTAREIEQVGLAVKKEQGYGFFDRFRNRLMIPIRNVHGAVIGFGGRVLEESAQGAKYINSPQTQLYDKGRTVFGLDKAKQEIRKADMVVLVEGYMDFFAVYQSGMKQVVATSGTALTIDQIRLIKRFTQRFYFAFDTDAAGAQATMRGIELALREGIDVHIVRFPKGTNGKPLYKDPDECVKKDMHAWQDAVRDAVSFVEYCFGYIITPKAVTDPFEKKKVTRRLLDVIGLLPDRIERDHWIKRLAGDLGLSENILWEELEKKASPVRAQSEGRQEAGNTVSQNPEDLLLSLLVKYPKEIGTALSLIRHDMLQSIDNQALYRKIEEVYLSDSGRSTDQILDIQKTDTSPSVAQHLHFLADHAFGELKDGEQATAVRTVCENVKRLYKRQRIAQLQVRMQEAEAAGDSQAVERYASEFASLQQL